MIDSIGNSASPISGNRAPALRPARLRADVITAVQQSSPRSPEKLNAVRVFAVPTTTSAPSTAPKLPRGSLVDFLA